MSSYNYSYNVLINRLEAFAAGHFLIKRFTHGQIDLADQLQDDEYPFMHVVPEQIRPVDGGMQFDFMIMFADIPRDKEYKAEYQREVISDCVRLGQDLIAEVKNGLQLFGFDVQLVNTPTFEPFMEEQKNTVTGVSFTLSLEVPWDWSACDIPAIWSTGGSSTGGSGTGYGITLQTNGVNNVVQNLLNLEAGTNITITDNGNGTITIDSTGGGGGGSPYVSTEWNANHTTAQGNQYVIGDRVWYNGNVYACIANNDGINPSNPAYWTLQSAGYRLRQTPVDWNASSGDYQILNKPTLATVATTGDYNDLINTPAPQGLQDVITTDNDLTLNNTIEGNATNLLWNANTEFKIYPDALGFFEVFVGKYPPSESKLKISATEGYLYSKGATTQQFKTDTTSLYIQTPAVSGGTASVGQVLTLQNASTGAVEYTTLPSTSGFVPYTGATQDVDLDQNKLSAESIYIEGTNGSGHLHMKHQSADATATGQSTALWADTNGDIKWKNDNNYKTTLKTSANVADRVYTFPDETCELMPRNAAITGATKTKITYDADGLVTAGADLAATDIPSGIDATKIGAGLVSDTEFGYLDGVTSSIQTQLNNKKDTFVVRMALANVAPADSTTYYINDSTVGLNTNATLYRTIFPFACKLVGASITAHNVTATASNEASTLNFRLNNSTDTLLSNAVVFNGTPLVVNVYQVTGLNVNIAAGDTANIKWTTPAWATNPSAAALIVQLYFERS